MKKKVLVFLCVISLVFILFSFGYYIYTTYKNIDISSEYEIQRTESTIPLQTVDNAIQESLSVADMIEKISQSVVGISKIKTHSNSIFSSGSSFNELGLGTGIVVSSNGYILSNCHVTGDKSSTCYITLENGYTYEGSVVWCDNDLDLSITKINANDLTFALLGNSSNLKSGENVFAIGNPIGYEFRKTVTSGIISATNRTIKIEENNSVSYMTDLIQTDASINPGNSGGPLINSAGEVIGVNTVKISTAEGIGFAVPINVVKPVIEKFVAEDKFDEPYLGIYAYDKDVIPYISTTSNFTSGIYIAHISQDSPAFSSNIKTGDIITAIDGMTINNMIELREFVYTKSPGDTISIDISHGYITKTFDITLIDKNNRTNKKN